MHSPPRELRLAIVTGGASGLGRAFCRRLAAVGGWHVVIADVDEPGAAETLAEIEQTPGGSAQCERLDVTDSAAWLDLRQRLQGQWPRLDLLVNNAGVCMAAEVGDGSLDDWRRVMEVNYLGVLYGCHTMTPWLKEGAAHRAAVINVASIVAFAVAPSMAAYSASKAAVVALSEAMYAELRSQGVRVTVVVPGFFRTRLLERGMFASRRHRVQAEQVTNSAKITADAVAAAALAGSARGRLYVVLGRRARWFWRWKRLAPTSLLKALVRRGRRLAVRGENATIGD